MNIHPKVSAGSAGVGYGAALAILVFWIMQGVFGVSADQFTPERVAAVTMLLSVPAGFFAAYLTNSPETPPPAVSPPGAPVV